ncbi:hypothetical protein BO78DRAFT_384363 [Aspergillus sclerotiicarbonarius CBS 121057]|uniref:Uncharacterized protein n=1 Tax=Aspergillus sclerotiicarbonarius (strain CBS 121057 / IBT 28362) TaxID=1448318 RepID=A0A319EIL7_ASPSB|nr:hypothetical protein BO78DRAFT_384363 [Aspergillus sclerotiicarbonarius CBS 121057]
MGQTVSTWADDPEREQDQLKALFNSLQDRADCLGIGRDRKNEYIDLLIRDSNDCIEGNADCAYRSLGHAVESLLDVQSGNSRLSRSHPAIVRILSDAVSQFEKLSQICREVTEDIGLEMGNMIALMDETTRFMRELKHRMGELNSSVPRIFTVIRTREQEWKEHRAAEPSLRKAVGDAEEERNDVGNSILGFLNPNVRENLEGKLQVARDRLARNLGDQPLARSKYESYYRYAMVVRNASAAFASLHDRLAQITACFRDRYNQLLSVLLAMNEIWRTSLVLRNVLWDADFTTSKDRALQVVYRFIDAHRGASIGPSNAVEAIEYKVTCHETSLGRKVGHGDGLSDNDATVDCNPDDWILAI